MQSSGGWRMCGRFSSAAVAIALAGVALGADGPPSRRSRPGVVLLRPVGLEQARQAARPIDRALELAYQARRKYRTIRGYTCLFVKRERLGKKLQPMEFIRMKLRNRPFSVYMKWILPHTGREVIYVAGQNGGKMLAHETGAKKVVAGTVALDPHGTKAMQNARHPITEAGIGHLIGKLIERWEQERLKEQVKVVVFDGARVDSQKCWCVRTTHLRGTSREGYYRTRVYFDKGHGLPIRFEGYGPPTSGSGPDGLLLEEYTYRNLRTDVVLTALDFSPRHPRYNFGRF